MKENTVLKKIEKYCDDLLTMRCEFLDDSQVRSWMYGAIDFAYNARLISMGQYHFLLKKYEFTK